LLSKRHYFWSGVPIVFLPAQRHYELMLVVAASAWASSPVCPLLKLHTARLAVEVAKAE
jgi:hypothetical protein